MQTQDLESCGHAAGIFQRSPRELKAALAVVQAERAAASGLPIPHEAVPALRLNGVPYFPSDQLAAAARWLADRDAAGGMIRG